MIEVDRNHTPVKKITEDKTRNRTIKELLPTANSFMVVLMEFAQFWGILVWIFGCCGMDSNSVHADSIVVAVFGALGMILEPEQ